MRYAGVFLILAVIISAIPGFVQGADHVIDSSKNPQYLFVMSTESGTFKDGKLTLKDVPLVIYFSDRPDRIAGHMSLKKFVEEWNKGPDSSKKDPPNAVLSVLGEKGNKEIVVEIKNPVIKGKSISFDARVLQGDPPETFGPAALFVDFVLGMPHGWPTN